ncbi:MAG: DUF342 domain-containing protein [Phycisphaerales bacterium]|nr:DUF342 domain-containing protein [Phycisphaerales bacterium]
MGNPDPVKKVHLDIARDALSVTIRLEPGVPPELLNVASLIATLRGRQVQISPDVESRISALLKSYAPDATEQIRAVVAVGTRPIHGTDGRLDLTCLNNKAPAEIPPGSAEGAAIDHHARTIVNAIRTGEVIGRVIEPTVGEDGFNVFGQRLASKSGKPVFLNLDSTVARTPDGELWAQADGVLEHRPPLLRVARELLIPGFVDFTTGNIAFPGNVQVAKGVRDCFELHVEGDLTVDGLVEAARINAKGNVFLNGGMAARERGTLSAGRNLTARYLDNVQCLVGRDLSVAKEIINCRIGVGRKVLCEGCAVSGGVLLATREVSIGQLGTPSAVATTVVLGRLAELAELSDQLEGLRPSITAWEERAASRLEQIRKSTPRPTAAQAEELTQLEFELSRARAKSAPIEAAQLRLRTLMIENSRVDLMVHKKIHAGVTLWIGTICAKMQEDIKGPIRITHQIPPELVDPGAPPRPTIPAHVVVEDLIKGTRVELHQIARISKHDRYEGPSVANAA